MHEPSSFEVRPARPPELARLHPDVAQRLRAKGWPGRQFGYNSLLHTVDTAPSAVSPAASVIVEIANPDKAALVGLKLLLEQAACPVQLILVDNASASPLTPPLLSLGHTRIRLKEAANPHVARNLGALFADAPWLIFLSDAVRPQADLPARFLACLNEHEALAARGDILGVNDVQGPLFGQLSRGIPGHAWAVDVLENMAVDAAMFFRLGGFDETLASGGALDLSIRIYAACPDADRQRYCPSAVATAGEGFDLTGYLLRRQKAWHLLNEKYARALLGNCVFWVENLIGKEEGAA